MIMRIFDEINLPGPGRCGQWIKENGVFFYEKKKEKEKKKYPLRHRRRRRHGLNKMNDGRRRDQTRRVYVPVCPCVSQSPVWSEIRDQVLTNSSP
uniref:Phage protein n=1 Tax=Caenorhabditis tropicalis TaxID=1561998 RepID=A0A1I7T8E3_9PELO